MFYLTNFIFKRNLVSPRWKNGVFTINRREVQTTKQKPTLPAVGCCTTSVGDQQRRTERGLKKREPGSHSESVVAPAEAQHCIKAVSVSSCYASESVVLGSGCSSVAMVRNHAQHCSPPWRRRPTGRGGGRAHSVWLYMWHEIMPCASWAAGMAEYWLCRCPAVAVGGSGVYKQALGRDSGRHQSIHHSFTSHSACLCRTRLRKDCN